MTETQRTFLERQLTGRIPRSYKRFLWFMGCILIALATLTAGQGFASVYLATLPHNSIGLCEERSPNLKAKFASRWRGICMDVDSGRSDPQHDYNMDSGSQGPEQGTALRL
jgi:hypothetical protein